MKPLAFLASLALLMSGCNNRLPNTSNQSEADVITYKAVIDWYEKLRNPLNSYHFDESTERYSDHILDRLKSKIPDLKDGDDASWYVELSPVHFEEENFAYVEILTGDAFYQQMYVQVFEKKKRGWEIIDRLTLESDYPAWIIEFDWDSYHEENENMPNQAVDTTAVSAPR